MQSNPPISTANYISIFLLTMVAFSGTVYLIFYAINKPPFELALAADVAAKSQLQCASRALSERNIPYEVVPFDERDWLVLRTPEERDELQSILATECPPPAR